MTFMNVGPELAPRREGYSIRYYAAWRQRQPYM